MLTINIDVAQSKHHLFVGYIFNFKIHYWKKASGNSFIRVLGSEHDVKGSEHDVIV
jgi:hypothetical protein